MKRACLLSPCSLIGFALLLAAPAWSQSITSSPNVVGSGARALGMGGAFIAVADDATSASWNPGGLTQLERPEFSAVYNFNWHSEDFTSGSHPELSGAHEVQFDQVNYLSFVYPIPQTIGGRNLVVSINYQRKFDFSRQLNLRFDRFQSAFNMPVALLNKIDYQQEGSLSTLSPAIGFELSDRLSLGAVWNIWDSSIVPGNRWEQRISTTNLLSINAGTFGWSKMKVTDEYDDIRGSNFTLGGLWRLSERWSIGAVYNTKFAASLKNTTRTSMFPGLVFSETTDLEYVFPASFGIGAAYRFPNDKLTVSMDVTRREWDQFVINTGASSDIRKFPFAPQQSGITKLAKSLSPHDPTYTVRLGGEYVFVDASKPKQDYLPSLRAGLFYDPEPASGKKDRWYGLENKGNGKVDNYYGFALGAGVLIKNRVNLDAAYTYRFGEDVRKDTFGQYGLTKTDANVGQHTFYVSTVVYF